MVSAFLEKAWNSRKERDRLLDMVHGCGGVLDKPSSQAKHAKPEDMWSEKIKTLKGPNTPIRRLGICSNAALEKLKGRGFRKPLKSRFDSPGMQGVMATIGKEKSFLILAMTHDCGTLTQELKPTAEENSRQLTPLITLLSEIPKDYLGDLKESNAGLRGISNRILDSDGLEYPDACGRTLRGAFKDEIDVVAGNIYCNFRHQKKAEHLLANLAKQFAERHRSLPRTVPEEL
ncbi:hypothetical protein MKZ38_006692 [Zalerion maritima]|uniref:Uncharacterized protein n=1 Tax=Zalerion maritima TaxID=339359 RepID=A0AAD5RJV2_9PEZI|nr:hypothetical protein MKZ38_006692 [Zalerion maritima]